MGAACPGSATVHCGDKSDPEVDVITVEKKAKIAVTIIRAWSLPDTTWTVDRFLYCTLKLKRGTEEILRSQRQMNVADPVWMEEVEVETSDDTLEFGVWEADAAANIGLLGRASLATSEFEVRGFHGTLALRKAGVETSAFLKVMVKNDGQDYPPEYPNQQFTLAIDNSKKAPLGLDVDLLDKTMIYVTDVKPGVVQSFNAQLPDPDHRLKAGDFIIRVNAIMGNADKLRALLKSESRLELLVSRPFELTVVITARKAGGMGVDIPKNPTGNTLLITKLIKGGPMEAWNEAHPDQEVKVADRIIAVNGERGKGSELMTKIKGLTSSRPRMAVTIVRPCPHAVGETAGNA